MINDIDPNEREELIEYLKDRAETFFRVEKYESKKKYLLIVFGSVLF
jgi:hypothetical protein